MQRFAFWLPAILVAQVDRYARQLQTERPDQAVTRADALRKLLNDALALHAKR